MPSAEDHILGFCHAFVRSDKRERLASLLSGKGRWRGVVELSHPDCIDDRFSTRLAGEDPDQLLHRLTKLGAGEHCYIISNAEEIDGRTMNLSDALREVIGIGLGTVVSCVPGQVAFYEGEYGPTERMILTRRPQAAV